jgi:integral membrane protein
MLRTFRISAILEGISYLLLFSFSMPLKYWANITEPNIYIGYIHGFLFIVYMIFAVIFSMERQIAPKKIIMLILASLLPFGTFYMDEKYLKPIATL